MDTASFTTHRIGNVWFKIMSPLFPVAQPLLLLHLRLRLPRLRPHPLPRRLLANVLPCMVNVEALDGLVLRVVHREPANIVMIGTRSVYRAPRAKHFHQKTEGLQPDSQ